MPLCWLPQEERARTYHGIGPSGDARNNPQQSTPIPSDVLDSPVALRLEIRANSSEQQATASGEQQAADSREQQTTASSEQQAADNAAQQETNSGKQQESLSAAILASGAVSYWRAQQAQATAAQSAAHSLANYRPG